MNAYYLDFCIPHASYPSTIHAFLIWVDGVFGFRNISRWKMESYEMKKWEREGEERKGKQVRREEGDCSFSSSITSCGRSVLLCCIWG